MRDLLKKFEEYMTAATFAEAGQHKIALEMLERRESARKRKRVIMRAKAARPRPESTAPSIEE